MDTISQEPDPFVRGKLYLELGNSGDKKVLAELLDYLENETDSQARLQALAAAAKLGNEKEGQAFIEAASSVSPDDIMQAQELLLYIAKPSMAKALSSWLDLDDAVMRLGSDRQERMARTKDIAVWTAHLLGIELPFNPTHLDNFSDNEIGQARAVLQKL